MNYRQLRSLLRSQRKGGLKWRDIGLAFPDVPLGTLNRIARDPHYRPRDLELRRNLGLYTGRRKYDFSTAEGRTMALKILACLYNTRQARHQLSDRKLAQVM